MQGNWSVSFKRVKSGNKGKAPAAMLIKCRIAQTKISKRIRQMKGNTIFLDVGSVCVVGGASSPRFNMGSSAISSICCGVYG